MTGRFAPILLSLAAAVAAAAGPFPTTARADGPADERPAEPPAEARLRERLATGPGLVGPDAVRAWARSIADEGRARTGTDLGGDLLAGAASALETRGLDLEDALHLVGEAAAAYPAGRAAIGFAWFERAVILARLGDAEAALLAFDEAARHAARAGPDGAPADDADRRAALGAQLGGLGLAWRADLLTALGRHAEAAAIHEKTALARGRRAGADAAWERAAVAAWRAGDRERAERDASAAIEQAREDGRAVDLTQWRLLARHDGLDARGEVRLSDAWPGEAFLTDARLALRALEGRRGAWKLAAQVASSAWAARQPAAAIEMYEIAFRDPSFEAEAPTSPLARQRIVTAAWVALKGHDPKRARAWLELAAQYAGGPVPGTEDLARAIDEALADDAADRLEGEAAPPEAPPPVPAPGRPRGELLVPEGPAAPAAPPASEGESPGDGDPSPWARDGLAALAALTLVAGLLGALGRRRRRARGPDGNGPDGRSSPP